MDELFDRLARAVARRMSRREALRLGSGAVVAAAVASVLPGRTEAVPIGTCPSDATPDNCKKDEFTDCSGLPAEKNCGCVERVGGGRECIERLCPPDESYRCKDQTDCFPELGEVCIKLKRCCRQFLKSKKWCALRCDTEIIDELRPSRKSKDDGKWSEFSGAHRKR